MLKVALLAAAVATASSASLATSVDLAPADDAPCHLVQSLDLACSARVIDADADGDGTISAAELAGFATPAPPAIDWAQLHPPRDAGLDFKDAAAEPATVLSAKLDQDSTRRLLPALFALGGLVVLLRGRPT